MSRRYRPSASPVCDLHKEGLTDFPVSAGYDRVRFLQPVLLGDTITAHYTVDTVDKERGRSIAKVKVVNSLR